MLREPVAQLGMDLAYRRGTQQKPAALAFAEALRQAAVRLRS